MQLFCGKAQFRHSLGRIAQNFRTRKLGEITVFYAVKTTNKPLAIYPMFKLFDRYGFCSCLIAELNFCLKFICRSTLLSEATLQRCSEEKVFWKCSKFTGKHPSRSVISIKLLWNLLLLFVLSGNATPNCWSSKGSSFNIVQTFLNLNFGFVSSMIWIFNYLKNIFYVSKRCTQLFKL